MDKYCKLEHLEPTLTPRRFHVLACLNNGCYTTLGSIRTLLLKLISETQIGNSLSQNQVLLADLSPAGHVWRSPESIYLCMCSEQCYTLDSDSAHPFAFINSWNFIDHIKVIRRLLSGAGWLLHHSFMIDWFARAKHCLFKKLSVAIAERSQSQRIHG